MRVVRTLAAAAIAVGLAPGTPSAQERFLAKEDIQLYGVGLRVEPAEQTVPKDIATIVSTFLQAPSNPDVTLPPFAPDAVVKATLRGPALAAPVELTVQPNSPFNIPPLALAGLYTLDDIRLVSNGQVLLRGNPESARITVIDKLLVTQVQARPLTAQEILDRGLVFDKSSYQAFNFTAAFAINNSEVKISFPVVLPTLQGATDVGVGQVGIPSIQPPQLQSLRTIIPDTLSIQTQVPNLSVVGFTLAVPPLNGQQFIVPPIPGVIVIPGDIGFLDQVFSVMLMVSNVAPAGSSLVVSNLTASIVLPQGVPFDPLVMANTARGQSPKVQPVTQPGADGKLGTADDVLTLGPGETGNAEFLVEGKREGSHVVEMKLAGTLNGLPIGPVPISGRAAGAVLVRNPKFTLTFTHPDVVTAGEPYTLDVTVTNTSSSPANFVSVNLLPRNLSGATLSGPGSKDIFSIAPGDSETVTFDLTSKVTGKVTSATLDSGSPIAGLFELKHAVGELGVPLSPDSLVLPKEANALPKSLRDAAIGLLGKAYAVATAPPAALPPGIQRFSRQIVWDRAVEVAAAGLRTTLHEELPDSATQLEMDFAGSDYSRLAARYPKPEDQQLLQFTRDNFTGFDKLRRESIRGDVFAQAVANLMAPDLLKDKAPLFHRHVADTISYRPGHISVVVGADGHPLPFTLKIVDAQNRQVGGVRADGKVVKQIPFSDHLTFKDANGTAVGEMALLTAPDAGAYAIRLEPIAGVAPAPIQLSIVVPGADGKLRHIVFDGITGDSAPQVPFAPADPYRVQVFLGAQPAPATTDALLEDPAPHIVGVVQQADADQLKCEVQEVHGVQAGRIVAVLFSEEVTRESVQDRLSPEKITNFLPERNKVVGVALQPGGRIVFLALRDSLSPFPSVARSIAIEGVSDLRGHVMAQQSKPMEATITEEGGIVSGGVFHADGTPVPFANVRLFALLQCDEPHWVGISSKSADENGKYQWDFVLRPLLDRIVAVDPETEEFRDVRFNVQNNAQQLKVDIILLGRGTLQGRTLDEQGRPLRDTAIRITSLTDQSQYGATSDAQGRFAVSRIPVGNVLIEAVNVAAHAKTFVAENIPVAGATTTRDIVLLSVATSETTVKHGTLVGHVLRNDGVTPVRGVPVVAYYASGSQPGVTCDIGGECAVALVNTDASGRFRFDDLVAGSLRLTTFDQAAFQHGEARTVLAENVTAEVNVLLGAGLGTVHGIVKDKNGNPVAGARVGGGLSLTTTNDTGLFTLTDVPVGHATIVAVSDLLASRGTADVDIVRAGEEVNVTIVLEATGGVAGVVRTADGTTPARGIKVYLFKRLGASIAVVGSATTDDQGKYSITKIPVGDYTVSAFKSDFSDGNVAPAPIAFSNQIVKADITFRGGSGKVTGRVLDDDGVTPLRARVSVSGDQVLIAGGQVGVGFQYVQNFKVVDSNFTTGVFTLGGLWVGPFTVRAAGQFSPDPVALDNTLPAAGATVQMDLKLQPTSQVSGRVLLPDGVTPAGANIVVRYKSDEFKVVCSTAASGEDECTTIPQGIQELVAVTDAAGTFGLPIVNAGSFTLTAEDLSGRTGQIHGTVKAGEKVDLSVRLVGVGEIALQVLGSDHTTPIGGAQVEIEQLAFPKKTLTAFADQQGKLTIGGGDAFSEGAFVVKATDVHNGGFSGRAFGAITQDGQHVDVKVYLFNQTGTVSGTVYTSDGLTPVPNAEVVVGNANGPIAFTLTDASGDYKVQQMPLGPVSVDVFEAATARRGFASGQIDFDKQAVTIIVHEAALGVVRGTVLQSGSHAPLKGWEVDLTQTSPGGRPLPSLRTTSSIDGTFSLPGVSEGAVALVARKEGINGQGTANGAIEREGQVVDIPVIATIVRPLVGGIQGRVLDADGSPAANVAVDVCPEVCGDDEGAPLVSVTAGADGTFAVDQLPIGRYQLRARSQVSANAGSASTQLSFDGETVAVTIKMAGLSVITGQVLNADRSPAPNVGLQLEGDPSSGCPGPCARSADGTGHFTFQGVPAKTFTITATDPVSGLKGVVGDRLTAGSTKSVEIVLEPTGTLQGRVFFQNASPAPAVTVELTIGTHQLFTQTGADGRFTFKTTPLGAFTVKFEDAVGTGTASRFGTLSGTLDLGNIHLDETPPAVGSVVPAPGAKAVDLDSTISIVFTEKVDAATIDGAHITLSNEQGQIAGLVKPVGDTGATFEPLAALAEATRYSLRVKEVKDLVGKTMAADYVATFTTRDKTAPSYADISPAAGTSGAPIATTIRIKYSEPIDPFKFVGQAIVVTSPQGTVVAGQVDYAFGNSVAVFTPAAPLVEDTTYRVQVAIATDVAGNRQAAGLDYTFSTTDRTAPHVVKLNGPDGVIENGVVPVTADVGTANDVAFVDFYVNDVFTATARSTPFTFALRAAPALGHPGDQIKVTAAATDTSGNRGPIDQPAAKFLTITADQPPTVTITAPANGKTANNGERIVVTVKATDDIGVTQQGYKAQTGNPQDAASKAVNPPAIERVETFGFNVPANAAPGSTILIEASASDTNGHVATATPVSITVLDAAAPTVAITGTTTGDTIKPNQQTTVVVSAQDPGGIKTIKFSTSGIVVTNESRTLDPTQTNALTSFTFQVPASAKPGDTVTLHASAIDKAGNIGAAADIILPVADTTGPTVTSLQTADGSSHIVPGHPTTIVAQATDTIAVTRIELTGSGAFSVSDAKQITPPAGSAQATFTINVPAGLPDGAVLNLQAKAIDIANNTSNPAFLSLSVKSLVEITLPSSTVITAGDTLDVTVQLPGGAPAGGQLVTFSSDSPTIFSVLTPSVTFAAGETSKTMKIKGESTGTAKLSALVSGVERASMTVSVDGGVVSGYVFDPLEHPVAGAQVTVTAQTSKGAVTDSNGYYRVTGLPGPEVSVKALDPVNTLRGATTGTMNRLNGYVEINIPLIPAGAIHGTVSHTNGTTSAGAGVTVEIFAAGNLQTPLRTTATDANGKYEFPVVAAGSYTIDATGLDGKRGRANATVPPTGDDVDAPIRYVGQGTVDGVVLDGNNQPVPNANLTFWTTSIFGAAAPITRSASGTGTFKFDDVLIGSFQIMAVDLVTGRSAVASGVIADDGAVVHRELHLVASGSVHGTVFRADGTTRVPNATVSIGFLSTTTDTQGEYAFPVVPLGPVTVSASHLATRGVGSKSGTLSSQGDNIELTIQLKGQGTVVATVEDANGAPVAGATVTVFANSGDGFSDSLTGTTAASGIVIIEHVLAGTEKISATKNGLSGTVPDRLLAANEVANVTIRLEPTATITGTVFAPNHAPQTSGTVAIVKFDPFLQRWIATGPAPATLDSEGKFEFSGLKLSVETPVGSGNFSPTYQLGAYDSAGRLRALVKTPIRLLQNGGTETATMTFVGMGTVTGTVLGPDNAGAPNIDVHVHGTNPDFGRFGSARTNAAGIYEVTGIPIGGVVASAGDVSRKLLGEKSGQLTTDGEVITLDIPLVANSVTLPLELFDASEFRFDIRENGSPLAGTNSTFYGADAQGGVLLDVIAGGAPQPFTGSENGRLEQFSREVAITQESLAGLNVTRKVFVPTDGYFARYLELFSNPTSAPITVDVRLTSHIQGTRNPAIVTTSSGDDLFDANDANNPDRWLVVDDQDDDPFQTFATNAPVALTFDGPNAPDRVDATSSTSTFKCQPICVSTSHFSYQWNGVTIPPGETVGYLHFVTQETSQAGAIAAAQRLVQLPPEALEGLSADEIAVIRNFAVPANGSSALLPLEPLHGTVTGTVHEGDNATVASAKVYFKSANPLFGRTYQVTADGNGSFAFPGSLQNANGPILIPESAFTVFAKHPLTAILSPDVAGAFGEGEHTAAANVVFSNAGTITGHVRRHGGQLVGSGTVRVSGEGVPESDAKRAIGNDGRYTLGGVPEGAITLTATVPHSDGSANRGTKSIAMTAGQSLTDVDINLDPTGGVSGVVQTGGGNPVFGAFVHLTVPDQSFTRNTTTDSSGMYQLFDVPVGTYTVTATDPILFLETSGEVTVAQDQTAPLNLKFTATGTVRVQVNYKNGTGAAFAPVYIREASSPFFTFVGYTDDSGRADITDYPAGAFVVRGVNPGSSLMFAEMAGTLTVSGQVVPVTVTLPGTAKMAVTVSQANGAAAVGATVRLIRVSGGLEASGSTDADGKYTFTNLALDEAYYVRALHPIQFAQFKDSANKTAVADGDVLIANITLPAQATVRVTVKRQDGSAFAGAKVQIKSAFDTAFVGVGTTDAAGVRSIPNVGEGAFAIRIVDPITNLSIGSGDGAIALADHGKTIDLTILTGVSLPTTLVDGNSFLFDIEADGRVNNGSNDAYDDAERLEVMTDGTSQPFTGAAIGLVEEGGREIAITQPVAGLDVTRKIFVPADGYFARYLEVLENTSASPVTVDVKIASNLGSNFQTEIAATSSGDTVFSAADTWLVTDDDHLSAANGDPSLAFVIGGAGATRTVSTATLSTDDLVYRWDGVTVPPNGTVILMHFAVQQRLKVAAIAAAQRLVQLPPEALAGLSADERAQIVNWQVPADGSSSLPPLPPRGGVVSGQALAADNVTVLKSATVTFLSPNSLMRGGNASTTTDANGNFSFTNVAIDAFTLEAIDPLTLAASPVTNGAFPAGQSSATRNVVFTNTGVVKGVVKRNGAPVNGFVLGSVAGRPFSVQTVNGAYFVTGLPGGTYFLSANAAGIKGTITVNVVNGQVTVADIPVGAGTITGVVKFARGVTTPAGTSVVLSDPNGFVSTAATTTDATGRYTFNSVSIGTPYTVTATHPTNSFAKRAVTGNVVDDGQTKDVPVTLPASANVKVTVFDMDGVTPFPWATIRIDRHDGLGLAFGNQTGPDGTALITNATEAGFTVQASDAAGIIGSAEGVVTTADDNGTVNAVIQASSPGGTVQGSLLAADGATPINAGVTLVELIDSVTGQVLKSQLAAWSYSLSASFPAGHGFTVRAHSPVDASTVVEANGAFTRRAETVQKDLTLPVAVVKGVIQYSDGAGVPFPNVTLTQTTAESSQTWFASRHEGSGAYGVVVLATGPFRLTAQDQTSGLTRTVEGVVNDLTSAIDLNVTLPESATVKGTLTSVDGQPMVAKGVRLSVVGMSSTRQTTTDAQGRFQFDHVALAPFRVQGCDLIGGLWLCAGDGFVLTSAGADLALHIEPPGSLSGTIFADASQTTVVPSADVYLVNSDYAGPSYTGGFSKHMFANASGIYASGSVPPGKYTATALASGNRAGIATGVLAPGGTNAINVTLGNASPLAPEKFTGTSGFLYDVGCDGEIYNGGLPGKSSFFSASMLSMSAGSLGGPLSYFPCPDASLFELNKRGVLIDGGRNDVVGLEVARKVFVPENAEFARYLEVFTNRTTMDLTVRVTMEGWLAMGDANATVVVKPSETGNTRAVFADASANRPSVGFVLGGQGAPVTGIATRVVDHRHDYKYEWVVTVPAGQTRSILNFVVQGPASDSAAVANQTANLAALSDPLALAGLTAAEKASIINFIVQ